VTSVGLWVPPAVLLGLLGIRFFALVLTADWRARKAGMAPAYNFIAMTGACITLDASIEMFQAAFR
jgi:hypothetical protein